MSKRVYISADYDEDNGDRNVVEELNKWGSDDKHKVDFVDMAEVVSGSVSKNQDCRACDLKAEFNRQISASSVVIFVVGDKTASRTAGRICPRVDKAQILSYCTPYKQNSGGTKLCKVVNKIDTGKDFEFINNCSYLEHEFKEAVAKDKHITIVYNSLLKMSSWLPTYMEDYAEIAQPFWIRNASGQKVGNYEFIKKELGYE